MENTKKANTLALDYCCLSELGKKGVIKNLFPQIRYLSLMENLFYSWEILNDLNEEFPLVENLIIGKNYLHLNPNQLRAEFIEKFEKNKVEFPQ